jgi:hypothetical protein
MSFFNTTDEMTLSAPKDSFTALGLGASLIEVM